MFYTLLKRVPSFNEKAFGQFCAQNSLRAVTTPKDFPLELFIEWFAEYLSDASLIDFQFFTMLPFLTQQRFSPLLFSTDRQEQKDSVSSTDLVDLIYMFSFVSQPLDFFFKLDYLSGFWEDLSFYDEGEEKKLNTYRDMRRYKRLFVQFVSLPLEKQDYVLQRMAETLSDQ